MCSVLHPQGHCRKPPGPVVHGICGRDQLLRNEHHTGGRQRSCESREKTAQPGTLIMLLLATSLCVCFRVIDDQARRSSAGERCCMMFLMHSVACCSPDKEPLQSTSFVCLPPMCVCVPPQTVLLTSMRKAGSLVLSYALFPKPITLQHLVGGTLILVGMYINDKVTYPTLLTPMCFVAPTWGLVMCRVATACIVGGDAWHRQAIPCMEVAAHFH
jgi:hypothetical protein